MTHYPKPSLADLFHFRWTVPILAELHRSDGAKFAMLAYRLDLSRESLSRTLGQLQECGWVAKNPRHGHPLRPEYVLTTRGSALAPACGRLIQALRSLRIEELALRKWPMPVTLALGDGCRRFSDIRACLTTATPRAIVLALRGLLPAGLICRAVDSAYPPTTSYSLTDRGWRLVPILRQLC